MLLSRLVKTKAKLAKEFELPPESHAKNLPSFQATKESKHKRGWPAGLLKLDSNRITVITATLRGSFAGQEMNEFLWHSELKDISQRRKIFSAFGSGSLRCR